MRFAIILLGLCAVIGRTFSQECGGNEFLCEESGVCIPDNRRCDGIADCAGGSDEFNCPSTTTTECPGMVCAESGTCIPASWICDGWDDCGDGSDEQGCATTSTTPCSGFTCSNTGECIPGSWICDGWDDCGNGEDEMGCATTSTTPCSGYVCASGRCINEDWICDGDDDCQDCSDELDCGPCDGFMCPCGKCIRQDQTCDGRNDCHDFADETEEACPCSDNEFRCPNQDGSEMPGACIPEEFVCDAEGIWDCPDGSDEANCTRSGDVDINKLTVIRHRPETVKAHKVRSLMVAAAIKEEEKRLEEKRRFGKSKI